MTKNFGRDMVIYDPDTGKWVPVEMRTRWEGLGTMLALLLSIAILGGLGLLILIVHTS